MSAGPGGIDGFFSDMDLSQSCRPLWWKASLHIHWWAEKHGIRPTLRQMKHRSQRASRGWSNQDVWGFDRYLATVIRDGVKYMNEIKHGHPCDNSGYPTFEEWGQILDEIVDGMQAAIDLNDLNYDYKDQAARAALEARHHLAMDHLKTWWFGLWD